MNDASTFLKLYDPSAVSPVLILTGPPGVGKTTVAALLAARFPRAVHLEADRFFSFIRAGYVEPWRPESNEQNRAVMGIVADAAAGYAAAGYFTVVEAIERVWQGFAECGEFESHVLDLGDEHPDEVAALLARHLEDGRLAA